MIDMWARWLAAESPNDISINTFAQYGVLGIITSLLVLFARTAYKREVERADRLEAENQRLNNIVQEKFIPALLSATRVVEEAQVLLAQMQRERDRINWREERPT